MRILIDDKIPFIRGAAEQLGETVYKDGGSITPDDVRDADVLIVRTRTRCNRQLLEGSRVKFIATATIGFDHLDTDYLAQAGIGWSNCPGCNAASVAQYVGCSLLLLEEAGLLRLAESCVGIVGVGHVGTEVARAAGQLGCRVLRCDPPRAEREGEEGFLPLTALMAEADVITFHTPLTREGRHATFHMADDDFFARLGRKPVIINSARGEVVCNRALKAALNAGQVRAAIVDTWENEPGIDRELLDRVFLGTPHIAGYSADGKACGTRMALEAVARHFGLPAQFHIEPPALPEGFAYYPNEHHAGRPATSPLRLYHPGRDSDALKAHPEQFEYLRGHYPLRREH